ncbi:RNA polymerase sigma factor [Oscillatoria amoena NRMC-F 0135]|nr:RNA polymerase sigma factor [Oscillatoria amoena NRMC-F 0135]
MSSTVPEEPKDQEFTKKLAALMTGYQRGDAASAETLVELVNPILARFLYATSWPGVNLEDMLQECWLRVHRSRSSYRPGEPPLPWLIAIARHTRVDSFRRWQRTRGRETELSEFDLNPIAAPAGEARIQENELLKLVEELPEGQREVVVMLKITGMSIQEVALATGTSTGSVKQRAFRAYQALRAKLQRRDAEWRHGKSAGFQARSPESEPGDEMS